MTFEELQRDHPEYFESAFKRIKHEALARMLDRYTEQNTYNVMADVGAYIFNEFDKVKDELEKELA